MEAARKKVSQKFGEYLKADSILSMEGTPRLYK